MKNEDHQVDLIGDHLKNKSIALCVTGGIAAIETPKLARHLRRYGADVKAYTTSEALKFIGMAALEWATEQPVVSELSGMAEHICKEDLVLVAPATLNTFNKIFTGTADNPVTTLIASALGYKKPIHLVPTMHESLYENPFFLENLEKASKYGIKIIPPRIGEGKKKMARLDTITAEACRELSDHPIKGKRLLVTAGPTPVKIDDVRMITNIFSGKLGREIAKEAYLRGADIKLLMGKTNIKMPDYLDVHYHQTLDAYISNVFKELKSINYDAGIFSAAVADYKPTEVKKGKIPSKEGIQHLEMEETLKVIKKVRKEYPNLYMTTFKYEVGITQEKLFDIAHNRLQEGYETVIANRDLDMKDNKHNAYIFNGNQIIESHNKTGIAKDIIELMGHELS